MDTAPGSAVEQEDQYWRRNLAVCLIGSFTTIVAMTLLLPFLPVYIAELGVTDQAAIAQWSGIAFGATFFSAALVAPFWGWMADRFGRKLMLVRASLGMAIAMSLMGMAHNVWELVGLRLFAGFAGGYASGATILVATQTPKRRSGWALGMLNSGIMAGGLVGPLIGGTLPPLIGIRATFWLAGGVIFLTFLATTFLIKEEQRSALTKKAVVEAKWSQIPDKQPVLAMLAMGTLLTFANMSIEPIITLYVGQLVEGPRVIFVAGLTMAAAALGAILSAPRLGKLADRVGHWKVVVVTTIVAALLLIPQAFVTAGWELVALRFLMGLALGGLMPCVTSIIRHSVPDAVVGRVLGYATSSNYIGQVAGPIMGGFVGGHIGMRAVFLGTALLMALGAVYAQIARPRQV
ncbi:MAG TPA: MFS transporter [Xanthobacteraceae bacterium]|jgi:MFS family permease|nr:MFS transporter [Xanthobacteraceae bacterium]